MIGSVRLILAAVICAVASPQAIHQRARRQDVPGESGSVIDSIFNIPITAIKQTAAAAQSFSPQNSEAIDSVLNIPVSTLEAVGNLVKATSGQRRRTPEESQRIRQNRRDALMAQRERQRRQREQLQQQRLKLQQNKRTVKLPNKDPFGVNALSLLIGNHGIFAGIQGAFGGHAGHGGHGGHGGQGGHGGHGGHGGLGAHGGHGPAAVNGQNTYEVHENIEEDASYAWHGITAGFGTVFGSRPTSTHVAIQNKIAPKDEQTNGYPYDKANGPRYDPAEGPPIRNKIAPGGNRIAFQR